MRETRLIMGMPITIEVVDAGAEAAVAAAFEYFDAVDRRFSPYKADSELSGFNAGRIAAADLSAEMREVLALADMTRRESDGYFDIRRPTGGIDPSGIVKGWAILNAESKAEAVRIATEFMELHRKHWHEFDGESEVRPMFDPGKGP